MSGKIKVNQIVNRHTTAFINKKDIFSEISKIKIFRPRSPKIKVLLRGFIRLILKFQLFSRVRCSFEFLEKSKRESEIYLNI